MNLQHGMPAKSAEMTDGDHNSHIDMPGVRGADDTHDAHGCLRDRQPDAGIALARCNRSRVIAASSAPTAMFRVHRFSRTGRTKGALMSDELATLTGKIALHIAHERGWSLEDA